MPDNQPDPKEQGFYFSLAQVGGEMAAPIGLGWVIDYYAGTSPWCIVGGAVFGLVGGLLHLVYELKRHDEQTRRPPGSAA